MSRRTFIKQAAAMVGTAMGVSRLGDALAATEVASMRKHDINETDLAFMSASSLARLIATRAVSSTEVVESLLTRIERYNLQLNAIVEVFAKDARIAAAKADKELAKGNLLGPLHGVPITIKDTYAISGKVRSYGHPQLSRSIQSSDSLPVSRLRQAGAVLIGRTNVPLFANDWQTFNEVYGTTNNPWDRSRTPGGSSGGCAAAISAGLSYLSLGGDLGGSIRVPAHFCGVFGHRPSRGIVPIGDHAREPLPPTPEWESFVAGPIARSAEDLRTAMLILGGFDAPQDVAFKWTLPPPRRKSLREYKVGYILDDPFCPLVPELRAVYEESLIALRKAGVRLKQGWPEGFNLKHNYLTWAYLTVSGGTTGTGVGMLVRGQRPAGERTYFEVAREAETGPFFEYKKQHHQRLLIRKIWQSYFKDCDAFLMPPSFVPAFLHGPALRDTNVLQTSVGAACYGHLNVWPSVSGLSGQPSTVFPAGFTSNGLPAGFEVLGPMLEDGTTIDLAQKLADVLGATARPPL